MLTTDHSGILVWGFLGLCSMIVVMQIAPAVMLIAGMVKGLFTHVKGLNSVMEEPTKA